MHLHLMPPTAQTFLLSNSLNATMWALHLTIYYLQWLAWLRLPKASWQTAVYCLAQLFIWEQFPIVNVPVQINKSSQLFNYLIYTSCKMLSNVHHSLLTDNVNRCLLSDEKSKTQKTAIVHIWEAGSIKCLMISKQLQITFTLHITLLQL